MAKKRTNEAITPSHKKAKNSDWIDWRNCQAKKRLLEDLKAGRLPLENDKLSVEDAWLRYKKEEGFESVVFSQFKARLKDHRSQVKNKQDGVQKPKDPAKKDWIDWRSKDAAAPKATIIEDLVQGILPLEDSEMSAEEAWTHYENAEGFEDVVFSQFKDRLKAHWKQVKTTLARSRYEEECLEHDRKLFPRKEVDENGIPIFDLHPAKELLAEDVSNNKHEGITPDELRLTRVEYKKFPEKIFRPRVYQAIRKKRFINYLNYAREVKNKLLRCEPRIEDKEKIEEIRKELFVLRRKKQKLA